MKTNSEDRVTAREVFLSARKELDEAARQRRTAELCGDDTGLRQEVDKMFAALDRDAVNPLDRIAAALHREDAATDEPNLIVTRLPKIGPYQLTRRVGDGGMGVVFEATQTEPILRTVAVKLIRPGMNSDQIVARFAAERQALAVMNHPNIAKILDAGATEDGSPYFVMELVQGLPITDFCDEHRLSIRKRLALFVMVCDAVQHAHRKGIIHRDLKPSNILVESHDGQPVPKVIDFGIAQAVESNHVNESRVDAAVVIGTPRYMSPEQLRSDDPCSDIRSDQYSLGVILEELLIGRVEDAETSRQSVPASNQAAEMPDAPLQLAQRLSILTRDELDAVAHNRNIDGRKLKRVVLGDLNWIVSKSLHPDPEQRYDSVSELADDVQRYLRHDAVEAHPSSMGYVVRKAVRRHPVETTALVLIVAILMSSTVLLWREQQRTAMALQRETKERQAAEQQEETAAASLGIALDAIDNMYVELATRWIANESAPSDMQRSFLTRAAALYQKTIELPQTDAASRVRAATAYERLGAIFHYLRRDQEAIESLNQSISLSQKLSNSASFDNELSSALVRRLRLRAAIWTEQGNVEQAALDYQQASSAANSLIQAPGSNKQQEAEVQDLQLDSAQFHLVQNHLDEAKKLAAIVEREIATSTTRKPGATHLLRKVDLAILQSRIHDTERSWDDAERFAKEGLQLCKQVRDANLHDERQFHERESLLQTTLGEIYERQGMLDAAVQWYQKSLETQRNGLREKTSAAQSFVPDGRGNDWEAEAKCRYNETQLRLARCLAELNRPVAAEEQLGECFLSLYVIAAGDPQVVRFHVAEANTWIYVWKLLSVDRPDEANKALAYATLVWREAMAEFPHAKSFRSGVHGLDPDYEWFRAQLNEKQLADLDSDAPLPQHAVMREFPDTGFTGLASARSWFLAGNYGKTIQMTDAWSIDERGADARRCLYRAMSYAYLDQREQASNWLVKADQLLSQVEQPSTDMIEIYSASKQLVKLRSENDNESQSE